jgi:hypothetical protein
MSARNYHLAVRNISKGDDLVSFEVEAWNLETFFSQHVNYVPASSIYFARFAFRLKEHDYFR